MADIQAHRAVLAEFAGEVTNAMADVAFCSLNYDEFVAHWSAIPDLADHATALAGRFVLSIR